MTTHSKGPLGVSSGNFGGLAAGANLFATDGMSDAITVFEDFNFCMKTYDTFAAAPILATMGAVVTDIGSTASLIGVNPSSAAANGSIFSSCLHLFAGTDDDNGGNIQISADLAAAAATGINPFQYIWIPNTTLATRLDGIHLGFACRVGLQSVLGPAWTGKFYIGWAEQGDVDVMVPTTGAIAVAGGTEGPLLGFHVNEGGSIDGIAQRTFGTAMAEGTNFTTLVAPARWNSGLAANEIVWFDLALHAHYVDASDAANNGTVSFAWRRVAPPATHQARNLNPAWVKHQTVLQNQLPYNAVNLVPTIELINGPVATTGNDSNVWLDWWTFGITRYSHYA